MFPPCRLMRPLPTATPRGNLRLALGGEPPQPGGPVNTLHDHIETYLRGQVRLHRITHGSAKAYRSTLYQFAEHCGRRPINKLGPRIVEDWMMSIEHLADATRYRAFSTVRTFARWLAVHGHTRRDITLGIEPPASPRHCARYLHVPQIAALIRALPDRRAYAIVQLIFQLGLRVGEVSRLQMGDWDQTSETLHVIGKGRKERDVPLPDAARLALVAYLQEHPATAGPIFRSYVSPFGAMSPKTITLLFSSWCYDAGIKAGPHDGVSAHAGRHTAATDVLRMHGDLRVVQRLLGHSRLSTTADFYIHHADMGELRKAVGGREYPAPEQDAA